VFAQYRNEILVRLALMQKHRLAALGRQLQLPLERAQLRLARRQVAVVIQAAFPGGDHFGLRQQRAQRRQFGDRQLGGVMRMHARGCEQRARVAACEFDRRGAACHAGPGHEHLRDPVVARALDHRVAVAVETIVGQVGADVDPLHGATVMRDGAA
jgi:hypothetical protein